MYDMFGVDLRSLACMRVGIGLILIADLINRVPNLVAHYSDQGVLPRWALLEQFANPHNLSLHLISGQPWVQGVLFAVAGVFAVCLTLGYRTRLMTVLSWAMLMSLHARNAMVLDAGDTLLRMMLFWSMFLPLGARWSFDAAVGRYERGPNSYVSVGGLALLLQLALMYFLSALFKNDPVWHNGQAIFQALQIDGFATPLGHWLLGFPLMLSILTYVVWYVELLGPILIFLPVLNWRLRLAMVLTFWMMHLGMGLSLELGHFPYICATAWLAVVPTRFWEMIRDRPGMDRMVWQCQRIVRSVVLSLPERRVTQAPLRPSVLNGLVATCFLTFVMLWNLRSYDPHEYGEFFPEKLQWVAGLTWIDQTWNMFSPRPMIQDGWYVAPGKMLSGREVDLLTGQPVTWDKPARVSATYPDTRWRKYMLNLWCDNCASHRLWFARYLTGQWNSTHAGDDKMETFDIIYMQQDTTDDGVRGTPKKVTVWHHECFK